MTATALTAAAIAPPETCLERPSGALVDLENPDPQFVFVDDIAHVLAMNVRFNGTITCRWTIADHALLCRELVIAAGHPELALAALHHDSHEYAIQDLTTPLKRTLCSDAYNELKRRFDEVIGAVIGVDPALFAHPVIVDVDRAAAHLEARAFQTRKGETLRTPLPFRRELLEPCELRPLGDHLVGKAAFLRAHTESQRTTLRPAGR